MTTLPIRVYGDPVLNQVTTEIDNIDGRIAALAQTMIETMNEAPGVGLAANQVGVQKRLFVYDKGEGPHVVVNPKILATDGEWTYEEGCLSVPGLSWEITRANAVHLVGYDLDGNELDLQVDEYEGRIFQHEMDHLDGVLLIERLDADQRREAKQIRDSAAWNSPLPIPTGCTSCWVSKCDSPSSARPRQRCRRFAPSSTPVTTWSSSSRDPIASAAAVANSHPVRSRRAPRRWDSGSRIAWATSTTSTSNGASSSPTDG